MIYTTSSIGRVREIWLKLYILSACVTRWLGNITLREGTIQENKRDAWSVCVYNERGRNILCLFVVSSWSVTLHGQWHCSSQSWLEGWDSNQRLGCCCQERKDRGKSNFIYNVHAKTSLWGWICILLAGCGAWASKICRTCKWN